MIRTILAKERILNLKEKFQVIMRNFSGFRKQLELKKFKLFFLCIMHKEEGEKNDKPRVV